MPGRRPSANAGLPAELTQAARAAPVPNLNTDPVWSLKPWPATVLLGVQEFTVPALTAADWLSYLMAPIPDIDGIVLDLLDGSEELIYAETITVEEVYEACLDLIATVCARPWWVALRQINVARGGWHVIGPKMLERVDFERVSIAAWLDILLVVTLESMDPKDTAMFVLKLEAVPAELAEDAPAPLDSMEMDRGSFLSLG